MLWRYPCHFNWSPRRTSFTPNYERVLVFLFIYNWFVSIIVESTSFMPTYFKLIIILKTNQVVSGISPTSLRSFKGSTDFWFGKHCCRVCVTKLCSIILLIKNVLFTTVNFFCALKSFIWLVPDQQRIIIRHLIFYWVDRNLISLCTHYNKDIFWSTEKVQKPDLSGIQTV